MALAILYSPRHPDYDSAVGYLMTFPLSGLTCMGRETIQDQNHLGGETSSLLQIYRQR